MNLNDQLATLLGRIQELAPAVWDAAMRQAMITARIALFWALISLLFGALSLWLVHVFRRATARIKAQPKSPYSYTDDSDGYVLAEAVSWIFVGLGVLLGLAFIVEYVSIVSNPTWAALKLILSQFSGK